MTPDLFEHALRTELSRKVKQAITVVFNDNRMNMISVEKKKKSINVRLSKIFASAGVDVVDALADFIGGKSSSVPPAVRKFIDNQPPNSKPGRKFPVKIITGGKQYNLRSVAERLNKLYFGGAMNVRITWGKDHYSRSRKKRRSIQYGSYDDHLDLIRVNPLLDSRSVPVEFLECVVYHEMLHKKLGTGRTSSGRRALHTPEFKKLEKEYKHYDKAVCWERKNISMLLAFKQKP